MSTDDELSLKEGQGFEGGEPGEPADETPSSRRPHEAEKSSPISGLLSGLGSVFNVFGKRPDRGEEVGAEYQLLSFNEPLPPDAEPLGESYLLRNGVKVSIGFVRKRSEGLYLIQEPELTDVERKAYRRLMYRLRYELPLQPGLGPEAYSPESLAVLVEKHAREISARYGAGNIYAFTQDKIMYYVRRDLVGYGPIDSLMLDGNIEDVKFSGYGRPLILLHRQYAKYGWLTTNILLDNDSQDRLARRLAQMGLSSLSTAFPMVECKLPNGDRLSAFYQYEVSSFGTSITIRRHKAQPLTVIELMEHGELSALMTACLWTLVEAKGVLFIVGQPGAGKTSLVNALGQMIRDSQVPVIIEDFPELNFPQHYKQSLVTRYSKALRTEAVKRGEQIGEINQEDLLRASLRIRPDYLIVGEILTREAPVFLQAINIGLSGMTSFHAEDVETAVSRLTEKTIGVDPTMLHLIDWVIAVGYVKLESTGEMVRRCRSIDEIIAVGNYQNVFKWAPATDTYLPNDASQIVEKSRAIRKVITRRGISDDAMISELEEKTAFIEDLRARGVKRFVDVSQALMDYYAGKVAVAQAQPQPEGPEAVSSTIPSAGDRLAQLFAGLSGGEGSESKSRTNG